MKANKILILSVIIASILFIVGATLGTLAIPIVLAVFYSWYWLFLYAGYALICLYVAVYYLSCKYDAHIRYGGRHK